MTRTASNGAYDPSMHLFSRMSCPPHCRSAYPAHKCKVGLYPAERVRRRTASARTRRRRRFPRQINLIPALRAAVFGSSRSAAAVRAASRLCDTVAYPAYFVPFLPARGRHLTSRRLTECICATRAPGVDFVRARAHRRRRTPSSAKPLRQTLQSSADPLGKTVTWRGQHLERRSSSALYLWNTTESARQSGQAATVYIECILHAGTSSRKEPVNLQSCSATTSLRLHPTATVGARKKCGDRPEGNSARYHSTSASRRTSSLMSTSRAL